MVTTTTPSVEGRAIEQYLGVVSAEVIIGANLIKDFIAGLQDFFGGRSGAYERVLDEARTNALNELIQKANRIGANAIVGIDFDYETIGARGSML
ncbi:MAG: YbjQ family protein, partial [Chitinophagaceae bacterium]|nr:YbjQ family protein [Chitinophagaceae bacterium]